MTARKVLIFSLIFDDRKLKTMEKVKVQGIDKCPHCGGYGMPKRRYNSKKYFIECKRCHAQTNEADTLDVAIMLWQIGKIYHTVKTV